MQTATPPPGPEQVWGAYVMTATEYEKTGRYDEAITALRQALAVDVPSEMLGRCRGIAYLSLGAQY